MKQAVLLVSHGTVESFDELPAFLRNVRHGREAPPELVAELRRRYEAIGGSPLERINRSVSRKLEAALGVPVRSASRLWRPYVKDVAAELDAERICLLPLAQHSAHVYAEAAKRELAGREVVCADNWGQTPALLDAFASRARKVASPEVRAEGATDGPKGTSGDAALLLTAHSLPKSVIGAGDPYEREVRASAAGVIERVGSAFAETMVAFQSQGPGADASTWLGPSLPEALDEIAKRRRRVVVAPIGFLADHVEILYDLDIEAKAMAEARGLSLSRTESLNDADDFVAVLADLAREMMGR